MGCWVSNNGNTHIVDSLEATQTRCGRVQIGRPGAPASGRLSDGVRYVDDDPHEMLRADYEEWRTWARRRFGAIITLCHFCQETVIAGATDQ